MYMENLNYDFLLDDSATWSQFSIVNAIGDAAVYYEGAHGNSFTHYTGVNPTELFWCDEDNRVGVGEPDSFSYELARALRNGSGYPPFNITQHPPVTFAMMCHCSSGFTPPDDSMFLHYFKTPLVPYYDGYGQFVKDQAVVTWGGTIFVSESQNQVYWFFSKLRLGKTVSFARDQFLALNVPGNPHPVNVKPPDGTKHLASQPIDCKIYGDFYTRIKGVYTGNDLLPSSIWWRPLPLPL